MSSPQGPDQPREVDPRGHRQEQYSHPPYQQPYEPQPQPYEQQDPPPQYPPPPPQYPAEQYAPQQPEQYGPAAYEQPPGWGQPAGNDPQYGRQYGQQQYGQQQYGQQQYGQQYGDPQFVQQYGYSPQGPPNRPRNRTPLIIAAVAVVVIVVVVGAVLLARGGGKKQDAQTPPTTSGAPAPTSAPTTSAPTTSAPTSSAPSTSAASTSAAPPPDSVKSITVPSVISGWHGVLSPREDVAYDVPPGWKVEKPGLLVGFEDNKGRPLALVHGVSTYKNNACPKHPGSYRGHTGFKTAGDLGPAVAALGGAKLFADSIALRDDGSSAPVSRPRLSRIRVDRGKIAAVYARVTVRLNDRSDCGSPSVVVVAVAFRSGPKATALFMGYFDQGVSDALPLATARKIFTTLRPYRR